MMYRACRWQAGVVFSYCSQDTIETAPEEAIMSVSFLLESIAEPTTPLTPQSLQDQNRQFTGTAGVSQGNQRTGLVPAFMDNDTGCIYLSHFANGSPAPIHMLDGLPDHLILRRSAGG